MPLLQQDYRETVIRLDYADKSAEVWTENKGLMKHLRVRGFKEIKASGKGVWLKGLIEQVRFRKARKMGAVSRRKGNPAALAAFQAARKGAK